jgi:[acyl-carrier-protein] S-malonyltransferase
VANVIADVVTDPQMIRDLLVQQMTGRVRWNESVEKLGDLGVSGTVEVGAGKVLTGLTRRINKELTATNIGTPADIETFLA